MSFTATVENDTIKLPPGVHLPDGTTVTIVPADPAPEDGFARPTIYEALKEFAGCIKDAPPDLAANHDHYVHGAPKGIDRL